jgi:hypothetical protein
MSGQWYYAHDGETHGPFSEQEIQDRVVQRLLLESDSVWPAGRDKKDAAPATAVFDFSRAPAPVSAMPDWLTDVAAAQTTGPVPSLEPSDEIPEWLEDMRLWVGLDLYTPAQDELTSRSQAQLGNEGTGEVPDWLESWLTPQVSEQAQPPQAAPAGPPKSGQGDKETRRQGDKERLDLPSPCLPVSLSPCLAPIPGSPVLAKAQVPATPAPAATPPPATVPSQPQTKTAAPKPVTPLVEKTLDASGFDLETGRILDQEKFRKWKQQLARSSAGQPAVSNASLFEVFRKARTAVEAWVDDEDNRACIMKTELEEIRRKSEIQVILHEYANYGQAMQEKLLRHLEFMVENRRKYYNAIAALRSKG